MKPFASQVGRRCHRCCEGSRGRSSQLDVALDYDASCASRGVFLPVPPKAAERLSAKLEIVGSNVGSTAKVVQIWVILVDSGGNFGTIGDALRWSTSPSPPHRAEKVMSASTEQRAILTSEFYWFGGQLGSPKVFDSGTSFSAHPTLRGAGTADMNDLPDEPTRIARVARTVDGWEFTLDEA